MDNKNSGEAYVADSNDNITKIAENIAATGGLLVTETVTDQAAISGVVANLFLSGGQVMLQDTTTGSISALAFA